MNNNPLRYVDPSGHVACTDDGWCGAASSNTYWTSVISTMQEDYSITFTGSGWNLEHKKAVVTAAVLVGGRIASERNQGSASAAFVGVYGHIDLKWETHAGMCGDVATNSGGCTDGAHNIRFWSMSGDKVGDITRMIKNVVHEFGHAFDWTNYDPDDLTRASNHLPEDFTRETVLRPNEPDGRPDWQQSPSTADNEVFADMFTAWAYGAWNTNPRNALNVNAAERWMTSWIMPARAPVATQR